MGQKDWVKENVREVKRAFLMHLLMNPLQYLCKALLGAQGYAVMIMGLQYKDADHLIAGIGIYIAGVLSAALCSAVDSVLKARTECGIRLRQKENLLRSIMYRKKGAEVHSAAQQEILITDVENIVSFFGTQISNFVTPIAVSTVCIAAVFAKSVVIAAIVMLSMILAAVINLYFLPRLHAQIREVRNAENALTAQYTDTILGSAVIRVFSCQKYYLEEIGRQIRGALHVQTKEVRIRFMQGLALNLLAFSSMTIPFLAGAILMVQGKMDLATMMYITQLSGNLLWFINTFTSTVTEMQKMRISRERIDSILEGGQEHPIEKAAKCDKLATGEKEIAERPDESEDVRSAMADTLVSAMVSDNDCAVRLEHLNVSLSGRRILRDISFEIPKGACVAFVGESGCGKTTLFKVLQDFVPYQGKVSLFGRDAASLDEQIRYSLMSLVSQDVGLINGTIYENILIGRQTASSGEVMKAAETAQVDRFANDLENGLDTEVGEGGNRLSGGERQRVSLARGLLKNAPILMLDEVTSALDPATEVSVTAAVNRLRGKCTMLIIAQKLNTIHNADRIYCLKDGEIAGQGTHEELMEDCEEYRKLNENSTSL